MNHFLQSFLFPYQEEHDDETQGGGGGEPKTYTQAEVDEMINGLKNQNTALLDEKKKAAQKAREAEAERTRVQQEAAKQSGQMEEFEKSIRGQYDPVIAEKDGKITKMAERILGSERKAVMGAVIAKGKFIDAEAADLIAPFIKVEFDGDDLVTKFVGPDGAVITTDVDKFIDFCKKHKVISHLMQADTANGGGAAGNKNPTGGAGGTETGTDRIRANLRKRLEAAKLK
ncbi:MAG: hypothetical protein ACRCYS_19040 [Beijerinckiaceae bacterium]